MNRKPESEVRLQMLLCGAGVNFKEGDLALSSVFLISSVGPNGSIRRMIVDTGHAGMRRNLMEALVRARVKAHEVDFVALTHAHWDHVQNLDMFPNAQVLISRAEWDSIQVDAPRDLVTPAWTKYLIDPARVTFVQPGEDILAGVEVIDARGHTVGSLAFAVTINDERHVITGDALPWAEVARLQMSALVFWNLDQSQETIRRLTDLADVLYPGHDRPFRLVDGAVEYSIPFSMTMFGAAPDTEGFRYGEPPILSTIDLTDGEPVGPLWTKKELEL